MKIKLLQNQLFLMKIMELVLYFLVEAILVTKKHNPTWNPESIHDIDIKEAKKLFQNYTEKIGL